MKKVVLGVLAACLLFALPATAKEGPYLGLFYPRESISGDAGAGTNSGGGWGLRFGMGFSRYVALEAHYSKTNLGSDPYQGRPVLTSQAADLKLNFPLTSLDTDQVMTLEPFIMVGYERCDLHFSKPLPSSTTSNGFQWGFGLELYLFQELSVEAGWTTTSASFNSTPKREGDIKTLDLGLVYHFI